MFCLDDTIAAVSSGWGPGARGIVRVSGPEAVEIVGEIFTADENCEGWECGEFQGRAAGRCRLEGEICCEAECFVFRAGHSYTGQDLAELHVPGSGRLLRMVLEELILRGARAAEAGEFTARAFFNGRMDLTQAEAVAEVIGAQSDAQLRAAQRLLDGSLFRVTGQINERLAEALALIEASIDFSDQDIEPGDSEHMTEMLREIAGELDELIRESMSWERLHHLPHVAAAGPANAGKSSLVNVLLGMERSVVNAMAGTTRDVVTAPLELETGECLLMDTAGLGEVVDPLAEKSQRLARKAASRCDVMLYVLDLSAGGVLESVRELKKGQRCPATILVLNKKDLVEDSGGKVREAAREFGDSVIAVSAKRGENIERLKEMIGDALHGKAWDTGRETIALSARQRQALVAAKSSIDKALQILTHSPVWQVELVALEVQEAISHFGEISGQIVSQDILGMIFSRFCIGK